MPKAVWLLEVEAETVQDGLCICWRNAGSVEGDIVPNRPPTSGIGWSVSFIDTAQEFRFSVSLSHRIPPRSHRSLIDLRNLADPPALYPAARSPVLAGNEVRLTLVEEDFREWQGGVVVWSASTNWDRYDLVGTCDTDRVRLTDDPPDDKAAQLPEGFPLPLCDGLTYSEHPQPYWRCSSAEARAAVVGFLERALPAAGFGVEVVRQWDEPRGPLLHESTALAFAGPNGDGLIVVTDVVFNHERLETILTIRRD